MITNEEIDHDLVSKISKGAANRVVTDDISPLLKIAAVLSEAPLDYYKAQANRFFGSGLITTAAAKQLEESSLYIEARKVWSLTDFARNKVLKGMSREEIISIASGVTPYRTDDEMQQLFFRYIANDVPGIDKLTFEELVLTYNISNWTRDTAIYSPPPEMVEAIIRKEELLVHFKRLTSRFKGQAEPLRQLNQFFKLPNSYFRRWYETLFKFFTKPHVENTAPDPMFITGVGGTGKSTLISKAILNELEKYPDDKKPAVIYIDFDRPGLSVGSIYSLGKEALRQLSIQFPAASDLFKTKLDLISDDYGGTQRNTHRGSDRGFLLETIFDKEVSALLARLETPIILVFDSFEELQYREEQKNTRSLYNLIADLREYIPQLRPVFIGRSKFDPQSFDFKTIHLEGLDELAAIDFMTEAGITDPALIKYIFTEFGLNPLTLKLVSRLLTKEFSNQSITLAEVQQRGILADIGKDVIAEHLVKRNLNHIHASDPRIRKIAVPGILIRKINPEIIKEILAIPCGIGKIDTGTAEKLFRELVKESFLFNREGEDFYFRPDLRKLMQPLIAKEKEYNIKKIHDSAVRYYQNRPSPEDQAEHLYHRLMRGDNAGVIDVLYTDQMRPYIEKTLEEFPPRAYLSLAVRLGLIIDDQKLEQLPAEDWDQYMKMQLSGLLKDGDIVQLKGLEEKITAKKDRMYGSSFIAEEITMLLRLCKYDEASYRLSQYATMQSSSDRNILERYQPLLTQLLRSKLAACRFWWKEALQYLSDGEFAYEPVSSHDEAILHFLFQFQFFCMTCRNGLEEKGIKTRKIRLFKEAIRLGNSAGDSFEFFVLLPKPYDKIFAEQLAAAPPKSDNFSNTTKRIVSHSRDEAIRLGNDFIGTEHLLLGILTEGENNVLLLFRNLSIDAAELRRELESAVRDNKTTLIDQTKSLPLTKQAEKSIRVSIQEANVLKSIYVEAEHLLLAILKSKESIGTQILNQFDLDYDLARNELDHLPVSSSNSEYSYDAKEETNPKTMTGLSSHPQIDFFIDYLEQDKFTILDGNSFEALYHTLERENKTLTELERYLKRNFDYYIRDIALPGEYPAILNDATLFIEVHPEAANAKVFTGTRKFADVKSVIPVEAFTKNDEVQRCLEKLKKIFADRELRVSEVRDARGNQYVNLVQHASGVEGFALLGYTHILEEMGIRFLQSGGSNTGALHAAFFASVDTKDQKLTIKLLSHYSRLNFRSLRDGMIASNLFFEMLRKQRTTARIIPRLLAIGLLPILSLGYYAAGFHNITIAIFAAATVIALGFGVASVLNILQKLSKGKGINPGRKLHEWVHSIFEEEGINTIEELISGIEKSPLPKYGKAKDVNSGLFPALKMYAGEMASMQTIIFPEMIDLLRKKEDAKEFPAADLVNACITQIPYFGSFTVNEIPVENEEIKMAWLRHFKIQTPPEKVFFRQAPMPGALNEIVKGRTKPRLPGFIVYTGDKNIRQIKSVDKYLPNYFPKMFEKLAPPLNSFDKRLQAVTNKATASISLSNDLFQPMNFDLSGEAKVSLFIKGALAATDFLQEFDWENYQKEMEQLNKRGY